MDKAVSIYRASSRIYIPRAYGCSLKLERFNTASCSMAHTELSVAFTSLPVCKSTLICPESNRGGYNINSKYATEYVRGLCRGTPLEGQTIKLPVKSFVDKTNEALLIVDISMLVLGKSNPTAIEVPVMAVGSDGVTDKKARAAIRSLSVELKRSGVFDEQQVKSIISKLAGEGCLY